jgi:hypothetical protein
MSNPETTRRGMHFAELGMLMAIVGAAAPEIVSYD